MKSKKLLTVLALTSLLTITACDDKSDKDSSNNSNNTEESNKPSNSIVDPGEDNNKPDTNKPSSNDSSNNGNSSDNNNPNDNDNTNNDSTDNDSTDNGNNPDGYPDIPNIKPENPEAIDQYYATATGEKGVLKNNLNKIISKRVRTSYGDLWQTYNKVDVGENGYIVDIYSSVTHYRAGSSSQGGNYKKEGDAYNREHTIPKSWWGGSKENQGADPFIVFPSDGYVNNRRSNYPFGVVSNSTYESINGYCKLGSSKYPGVNGPVFEPADEWKGDMARAYFYALTCYNTTNWNQGNGYNVFTTNGNYGLTDYASKLLLKWHFEDPVSEWEMHRNDGIYKINKNRNPYIDHPEFVERIWGNTTF